MPEEKVAAPKRATKKTVAVTETAKPKKAAAAPVASKAAQPATKAVTAVAAAGKPKKAAAAPKATSTPAAKTVAKVVGKAPVAAKPTGEAKKKAPAAKKLVDKPAAPSVEERQRWIATAAYHRAEKRGFAAGYEVQDWFDAEAEIDALVGKA